MNMQEPLSISHPISRRNALLLGALTSAGFALSGQGFWAPSAAAAESDDEFGELRQRWANYLTGGTSLDSSHPAIAQQLRVLSDEAGNLLGSAKRTPQPGESVWSDLPLATNNAANTSLTYERMLTIATAWSTPGTEQDHDPSVESTLLTWYRRMYTDWYNEGSPRGGNWWFWEIGVPRILGDLSILLDPALSSADRASTVRALRHHAPNPNVRRGYGFSETGGNRADKALACLLRGIIGRDSAEMTLGRDALSDIRGDGRASLFKYVSSGNGFYQDGSYIDHGRIPYIGTYGNVALAAVARSLMLVAGTSWDVTDPNKTVILDSAVKSFAPFIFSGRMMETVRGRAVSRERERDFHDAWTTANSLMLLATQIAEPYRSSYQSLAKGWITSCSENYSTHASLSDLSRALPLLADQNVDAVQDAPGHLQFGAQERMVHRGTSNGAAWAYTVATSSSRIGRYEWGNNENNLGWHHGDGVGYLHLAHDQGQFADDFWPTVDPYRLPGTTASLAERTSGAQGAGTGIPRTANSWSGGVALSRRWGTSGMDLTNSLENVTAKKSWFLLDDMIIAIGSGITVSGSQAVTVVENRSFTADASPELTVDKLPVTSRSMVVNPSYAHLEGIAGYIFLGDQNLVASVNHRSGTWNAINSGSDTAGSEDSVSRTYASLDIEHSVGTNGGTYGYVIVPGASRGRTAGLAKGLKIDILRQDDVAHIVRVKNKGRWFIFAHFFAAATDGVVRANSACAVAVSGSGRSASLAVSSPSKNVASARIEIETPMSLRRVTDAHDRLSVVAAGHTITLEADLSGSAGASFEANLEGGGKP